jgi:hypothetical protein
MTYDYFLQRIYQECLGSIEDTAWPTAILARAGKAYERIFTLNLKHGYVQPTQYDHQAVYYMAEWIQRNVQNGWVQSLALKDLAARITDQILDYYRRNDLPASILFLAAQPVNTPALRLDQEAREIVNTLRQAGDRRFTVHQWHAVRPEDVTAALLEVRPEIVHISGHGTPDGSIWLQDRLGNVKPASASALSALFQCYSHVVSCVILNACFSEEQARAISCHIDDVIGMRGRVTDEAAIAFTLGFYQCRGAGRSVMEAFQHGCLQMGLQGLDESHVPVLFHADQCFRWDLVPCDVAV